MIMMMMMMMTMMTYTIPYRRTKTHIWDKVLMGIWVHPLPTVPSGYPNPTRYPVFLAIPDPIQF